MKSDTDREHNDRHGDVSPREADSDHTYITNLINRGVDPKTVQYLAGHKNSKETMDIYAAVKYNKPKELIGVVNQAFSPKTAQKQPNSVGEI